MSGGNDKKQTQQTTSEPWKTAQPALQLGLKDAQNLYKAGTGSQVYTGSTVVPFSGQTEWGLRGQESNANWALPQFQDQFARVAQNASNGGLNDLQRGAVDKLQSQANGSMLNGNPFLDQMIAKNSKDINDAVGLSAAGSGRYGSGVHQGVLADAVGDMANTARFNNYNTERGFMQDAIGSLFNAGQQQQTNINGNTGAITNAFQSMLAPSQALMDVGGMREDLSTRQLNDQLRVFDAQKNAPWEAIARLNGVASGAGAMGGTSTTSAAAPSRMSSTIGGGLAGFGATGSPWGALLGGAAGLFG